MQNAFLGHNKIKQRQYDYIKKYFPIKIKSQEKNKFDFYSKKINQQYEVTNLSNTNTEQVQHVKYEKSDILLRNDR